MPHGVERQNLQRTGSENAGVIDEQIKAGSAKRVGHARGPGFHSLLLSDVADGEADAPAGRLLQILDLHGSERRTEDDVASSGEPKSDIAAKAAAGAGNHGGLTRFLRC